MGYSKMKSSKQIAQSADQKVDFEKAVSYIRSLRLDYQRAAERQKRIIAAVAEYNKIYPASENYARFSGALAEFMEHLLSKFSTMSVRWYDPVSDNFSENAPMTIFHLKEYVKEKFQDCESQMGKESETEPDVDRFVRVCEVLKKIVRISAEDQSLLFLASTCYVKGLELLSMCQVRIGKYFSVNEQERMERAWRELFELIKAIFSSLGFPVGLEKMASCESPVYLKRMKGVSVSDRWFRFLFDGNREHAIFNPSAIAGLYSHLSILHNLFMDGKDSLLVRDVFAGKGLYEQLLPLEEYFAYVQTNKYKADEVLERVDARIRLIAQTMNRVFEQDWERISREREDLIEKLNSSPRISEKKKRECEARLNSLEESRRKILNLIDKAGYKLEDLLRGEIEVEKGSFVKIHRLPGVTDFNAATGVSPVKQIEAVTASPAAKPDSEHVVKISSGEGPQNSEDAVDATVSENTRGKGARFKDELRGGKFSGKSGIIRITVKGESILWQTVKRSDPKPPCCELSAGPAIRLMEKLFENTIRGIDAGV